MISVPSIYVSNIVYSKRLTNGIPIRDTVAVVVYKIGLDSMYLCICLLF